jgi:hypothetical protein
LHHPFGPGPVLFTVIAPCLGEGTVVEKVLPQQGLDNLLDLFRAEFFGKPAPHLCFTSGSVGQEAQCGVLRLGKVFLTIN